MHNQLDVHIPKKVKGSFTFMTHTLFAATPKLVIGLEVNIRRL